VVGHRGRRERRGVRGPIALGCHPCEERGELPFLFLEPLQDGLQAAEFLGRGGPHAPLRLLDARTHASQ
jgi:hypothetical protein